MLLVQKQYTGSYDSVFAALACLRASLVDLNRAIQAQDEAWQMQRFTEILFWVSEYYGRRAAARCYRAQGRRW